MAAGDSIKPPMPGCVAKVLGKRFTDLQVHAWAGRLRNGALVWWCECVCGTVFTVPTDQLVSGRTKSCGCRRGKLLRQMMRTHGLSRTITYSSWKSMISRCGNPKANGYDDYGGRGVKVCDRWKSIELFIEDMGERPSPKHEIDRFPNQAGNYEPGNCRWATRTEQAQNMRKNRLIEYGGESICLSELARRVGVKRHCLEYRLNIGMSVDHAIAESMKITSSLAS